MARPARENTNDIQGEKTVYQKVVLFEQDSQTDKTFLGNLTCKSRSPTVGF
jgi:hypothetical protein